MLRLAKDAVAGSSILNTYYLEEPLNAINPQH